MASKEELSEQLLVTQKLVTAIDSMAKSMARVESSFDSQIASVEQLTKAINTLKNQDLNSLNQTKMSGFQKQVKESEKVVTSLTGRIKTLGDGMRKKLPEASIIGVAALSGMQQGVRNLIAMTKGVTGFFGGIVDGAFNITAAIIAIPFKMFNALVDLAANASGGSNELAQALENLRKEMGDLKGPGTSAVLEASKSLKGFSDTGLSAWRVFGTLAEKIELVTKVAVAMGATFGRVTQEFKDNGGALLAYQKGLGIADDQMKSIGDTAIRIGKPMAKVFLEMTKQTLALGKAFDIDQKLIGKDMAKALQDVKHFGALAVKEIGQASVYARKLGVELDKIVGTLDAFETFDAAAENAAKLSQSFGVNIDAFKLMEAQNPAEQLDMLRKSFREAGIDASTFTRQQAKLLASSTGLDEAVIRQTFSLKNQGVSLDNIKKKSEAAEKKTLTQAEAMEKLADSIERMVKSGGAQSGGFWEMFVKGFLGGIQASKEFREIIMNIKRSLQLVYVEGVRLGKAFVEMFPGVKQFLQGIADFFNPAKFKTLVKGVVDVFIQWMKDLNDPNGKASFTSLMDNLREKFFDFFDASSSSGKKMLDGFKTIMKTMSKIVAEGIKWAAGQLGEGIQFIIDLVTGKKNLKSIADAGSSAFGFLGEILLPLGEALVHAWTVVAPKLWELVKILAQKLYGYLTSKEFIAIVQPAIPYLAAALFGPTMARALLASITMSIGKAAIGMFTGPGGKAVEKAAEQAASRAMNAAKKVSETGGAAGAAGMAQVGAANKAAGPMINPPGAKNWGVQDAVKLGAKLVAIAGALAIGGVMMAGAIVVMKKILDAGGIKSISDAAGPLVVLASMVTAAIPLMLAVKIAANLGSPSQMLKGGLIVSAVVALVGAVGAGLAYMFKQVADPTQLKAAGDLMLKMSLVFLAMVPLIMAAIPIGALATGPQALILGVAAAGMAVIGKAVSEIATLSVGIIKELSVLKIDGSFKVKIDAFLGVMKAIQAFTDALVNIMSLMQPTITEFVTGTSESFTQKVDSATKLISEMVGQRGGKGGIIGIVEVVIDSVKMLGDPSSKLLAAGELFANIMTAVADFAKSAAPPDAFYTEGGSFINKLVDPQHNFANLATDVGYFAKLMRENLMQLLTGDINGNGTQGLIGIIKQIGSMDIPSPESAAVIAQLFSATANILKEMVPDGKTLEAFQKTAKAKGAWGLVEAETKSLDVDAIKGTIESMAENLNNLLPVLVSNVITSVTDIASGLDKEQIENVKALGGLMTTVSDIVASIVGLAKGRKTTPVEIAGATEWITEEAPDLELMFSGIAETLPGLMKAVIDAVMYTNMDANFGKKLESAQKLFGFIGEIPKLAQSIAQTHGKEGGDVGDATPMIDSIRSITTFFSALNADTGTGTLLTELMMSIDSVGKSIASMGGSKVIKVAEQMKSLFSSLSTLASSMKTISGSSTIEVSQVTSAVTNLITGVTKSIDPLSTVKDTLTPDVMKQVGESIGKLKEYSDQVMKLTTAMKSDGVATALTAANDIIKKANELDKTLNDGIKIDTPAKLTKLANAVGLGSKMNYTIKNKEVVLTVNLNVTMNVDEVEKVMILRKNSMVRDRINVALGDDNKEAALPDNRNSPVIVPFSKGPS